MAGLVAVTRNVLVATHAFCTSTTTVIAGDDGCLVVDPGITPADLDELAAELTTRRLRVAAGFATHPHWDHVLWSRALGADVPRFATADCVAAATAGRDRDLASAQAEAPGTDGDLFARLTPLPDGGRGAVPAVPWRGPHAEVVAHRAHAPGHAALVVDGVLIAGDMCSDVEVPLLDLDAADPLGDYHHALDLFEALAGDVRWVVPGHVRVGDGAELRRRLAADRRYLNELAAGRGDDDPRLTVDWLVRDHVAQRAAVVPPGAVPCLAACPVTCRVPWRAVSRAACRVPWSCPAPIGWVPTLRAGTDSRPDAIHEPTHHTPTHHRPTHHTPTHHRPTHHRPTHHRPAHATDRCGHHGRRVYHGRHDTGPAAASMWIR